LVVAIEGEDLLLEGVKNFLPHSFEWFVRALNNPVLLVTKGMIAEFTLNHDRLLHKSSIGDGVLRAGISKITFVPLNTESFSMLGEMFVEGFGEIGCKGGGYRIRRPLCVTRELGTEEFPLLSIGLKEGAL
jgi:hypothetical protein